MNLTSKDKAHAQQYYNTTPKQFGNLHERMRFVMTLVRLGHSEHSLGRDLWHALFDLETEVKHYEPQMPPYGRRVNKP